MFSIIHFLLFAFQTPQKQIKVVDADSKNPVPFVSFTRLSDKKGSFADEKGIILFQKELEQQYAISCVGYKADTIIPSKSGNLILLKPKSTALPNIDIVAKRQKKSLIEIGSLSSFAFTPYWDEVSRKMEVCTFVPTPNKEIEFGISTIKIDIGAAKSKIYKAYLIRLFIRKNDNKIPGESLLTRDVIVEIKTNSFKHAYSLNENIILPKEGCFVGFETVGKIEKNGRFIPFNDFYEKTPPFQLAIRLVNSNSYSRVRFGSFDWMTMTYTNNHPDTYAIGLDVYPIAKKE